MENQETLTDICEELRSGEYAPLADRIEAARKREGVCRRSIKIPVEVVPTCSTAAIREALKACVAEMCDRCRELAAARGNPLPCLSGCEPVRKAKFALVKPVRNCDVARDWLHLYIHFKPPATVRREMPPEWVDAVMAFCKWLVAQAKDTKGESDGSK